MNECILMECLCANPYDNMNLYRHFDNSLFMVVIFGKSLRLRYTQSDLMLNPKVKAFYLNALYLTTPYLLRLQTLYPLIEENRSFILISKVNVKCQTFLSTPW